MKKILSLSLAVAVLALCLFAFVACDLGENGKTPSSTSEPKGSADPNAVIATAAGTDVLVSEFQASYTMYINYYSSYGYDITSDADALAEFKDSLIERMLSEKVAVAKAKELGLDKFTDEQQKEIDNKIDTELKSIEDYYMPMAEEKAESDSSIDVQEYYKELVAEESVDYTGKEMTYDEYIEYVKESIMNSYIIDLYKKQVAFKDIKVKDSDITAKYDELVSETQKRYDSTPASYQVDQNAAEKDSTIPAACVPEGYSRIMHILIAPQGETTEKYKTNADTMSDLEAEYGELAFKDAVSGTKANSARMTEILSEYKKLKAENDEEFKNTNQAYAKRADEAYKELQSGSTFKDVMLKYSEDSDFKTYATFAEKGKLISSVHANENDWSDSVKSQFAKLKVGEYSKVFEDEDGYHIIYYVSDETPGVRTIDDLRSFIETDLKTQQETKEWEALVDAWVADSTLVTINKDELDKIK